MRSPSFRFRRSASTSSRVSEVASCTSSSQDPQNRVRARSSGNVDHMPVVAHGFVIFRRSASGSLRTIEA